MGGGMSETRRMSFLYSTFSVEDTIVFSRVGSCRVEYRCSRPADSPLLAIKLPHVETHIYHTNTISAPQIVLVSFPVTNNLAYAVPHYPVPSLFIYI